MKQRTIHWSTKAQLAEIIAALEADGYHNVGKLDQEYDFPVIIADDEKRVFFGTNTTCMAVLVSSRMKGECLITRTDTWEVLGNVTKMSDGKRKAKIGHFEGVFHRICCKTIGI